MVWMVEIQILTMTISFGDFGEGSLQLVLYSPAAMSYVCTLWWLKIELKFDSYIFHSRDYFYSFNSLANRKGLPTSFLTHLHCRVSFLSIPFNHMYTFWNNLACHLHHVGMTDYKQDPRPFICYWKRGLATRLL